MTLSVLSALSADPNTSQYTVSNLVPIGMRSQLEPASRRDYQIASDSTTRRSEYSTLGRRMTFTSIVWLIALGKFFMVQDGVSFSGGSCEDAYDSVKSGMMTCVLPFVPKVPDSSRGFL